MTQITPDQDRAVQPAQWTEEEAASFAQTLVAFGKSLPPRQRDAFAAILTTAGARGGAGDGQGQEDVEGFFFYNVFFFPVLQAAGREISGSADLKKEMEGQQLYIPQ